MVGEAASRSSLDLPGRQLELVQAVVATGTPVVLLVLNGRPLDLLHGVSRGVTAGPGATSESSITGSFVHEADSVPWLLGSPVAEVSWQAPRVSSEAAEGLHDPQLLLHHRSPPRTPGESDRGW